VLTGLLTFSALQRPPAMVPGVRIVSLPGGGGGGPKREARAPERQPAPTPPEVRPKPASKPVDKAPPERKAQQPPDPRGARPARKQEIVSKTPSRPADVAPTPPVSAAGTGAGSGSAAARAGAGTGGVGFEADGEIGPLSGYLGLLRDKVAANWQAPPGDGRTGVVRAVVFFEIRRAGGDPERVEIQVSSGIPLFDRMALSAVLSAAPLQPLPSVWREDAVDIRFTFYQEY
jgi:TonB family protein